MKVFADDKINVTEKLKFHGEQIENVVVKKMLLVRGELKICFSYLQGFFSFSHNIFHTLLPEGCENRKLFGLVD